MHLVETIDEIVRTSRQMLLETGRKPTPEEIADKLGFAPENVRKVLKIVNDPILLENPYA